MRYYAFAAVVLVIALDCVDPQYLVLFSVIFVLCIYLFWPLPSSPLHRPLSSFAVNSQHVFLRTYKKTKHMGTWFTFYSNISSNAVPICLKTSGEVMARFFAENASLLALLTRTLEMKATQGNTASLECMDS